jgi:acetyl-CoA synthetase
MANSTYSASCNSFSWRDARSALGWGEDNSVCLAQSIIDRHKDSSRTALVFIDKNGAESRHTYRELSEASSRVANLLARLGVKPGDCVAGLMPRGPEVLITMLGAIKLGAVYVPIFTGFGPEAVEFRLKHSGATIVVTHDDVREQLPDSSSRQVVCVGNRDSRRRQGDLDFRTEMEKEAPTFQAAVRARDAVTAIIYTSGSTGQPKGGGLAVNFLSAVSPYLVHGAGLRQDDIFWPTGDPGWGYGFVCYLGALAMGCTIVSVRANPTPELCLDILKRYKVTNLATTPTLLRSIMALGQDTVAASRNPLHAISSCGEPLNAEVVEFFRRAWNLTPMDHFGATEYALPIGNFNSTEIEVKAGSMGLPFPGFQMGILDEAGQEITNGDVGLLAKKKNADCLYWVRYWNDQAATDDLVRGDWIVTGDLARRDEDGYFWFEGRTGDMIKSSGYRIGPFEVESALLTHPAVAEAAVIGKPDSKRGQLVKAFIVLLPGFQGSEALAEEIKLFVKSNIGAHLYPREIEFVDNLPKTDTGKIQRFALRNRS